MGRPKKQRRNYAYGDADKATIAERRLTEQNLAKDYKAYVEASKKRKGEDRKETRMSFDEFRDVYYEYYTKAKVGKAGFSEKKARKEKLGEKIYEYETSAFTEKQFGSLKEAITRAKKEMSEGKFDNFTGDVESFADFMAQPLSENYFRENYTAVYSLLRGLFDTKEEFEAWISPEVSAIDI